MHGTTIIAVRHNGRVAMGGDGQVSVGNTIMKHSANKVRRMYGDKVIGGFAGVVVDGLGYTMFFLYAGGIGIPAMLLVFAVMRFEIFSDTTKVASQIPPN